VQGKGLAALVTLLVAVALAACGGDGASETTAGGEETSQAGEGLARVQERAEEIKKERQEGPGGAKAGAREEKAGGSERGDSVAPDGSSAAPPPVQHSDSAGGAAQFQSKGGDNSIQEFGQEGGSSEFARAAAVLHAYLDARASRDWETACSYLSAEVIAGFEQFAAAYAGDKQIEGCPDVLEGFSAAAGPSSLRDAAKVDVGSLRLEGERGFLLYHGAGGDDFAFPVTQEGGEWKLAAPDATPLL